MSIAAARIATAVKFCCRSSSFSIFSSRANVDKSTPEDDDIFCLFRTRAKYVPNAFAYIDERNVKDLEAVWEKNPRRVSEFLAKYLAAHYGKVGMLSFHPYILPNATFCSTAALVWAKEKGVLTEKDVASNMKPNLRWFFLPVVQQLETVFPEFRFSPAVYECFEKGDGELFGDFHEEATHVHYLGNIFPKHPRSERTVDLSVRYISQVHEQHPEWFEAFLLDAKNKPILTAYVKKNVHLGKTLVDRTNVPYSVNWAENFVHSNRKCIEQW